ncbi:NHL repeat-containing protein [Mucilaginibacter sp. CSA2-8R]|uniref:NHL repeat-containing protein n=1 Tax=Mucilaginibacter sp. CSA2-8R TaxID=3141542 RepID=UPI00315CFB3F
MTLKQIYTLKNSLLTCFVATAVSMAACNKSSNVDPVAPSATTVPVLANLTSTGVQASGMLTDYGSSPIITASGVVYSASNSNPTISDSQTSTGTNAIFKSDVTGLTPNTTYYLRAYIKSDAGTGYGSVITFKTSASTADTSVTVSTLAGSSTAGLANGTGVNASFNSPSGTAVDAQGNVYVTDSFNHLIRKVTPAGVVTTFAGSGALGFSGGTATTAQFYSPNGIATDATGNVYVSDLGNNAIYKITSSGTVTILAGSGTAGYVNGAGSTAAFNAPQGVVADASGNVYVADQGNNRIRKITSAGVVSTLAGTGAGSNINGDGTTATFNRPYGLAINASGNLYVTDLGNYAIRKVTAAGVVSTLIGNSATTGLLNTPTGIAIDSQGVLYITDQSGRILTITTANVLYSLAGKPNTLGFADGSKTTAQFSAPNGIAVDANKNIYVADNNNNRVRKLVVTTK